MLVVPAEEEAGASAMDRLQQFMARALSLGVGARKTEEVAQVLDEVSFEGVARFIKSGKCKNIITMVGAGISTCKYSVVYCGGERE